jgi:hypothetical protein
METCGGGTGPLCVCFSQLSTIQSMYYGQIQELQTSWELFRRVELYNSNVSTMRSSGNSNVRYWQFGNAEELTYYRQGGQLYFRAFGYSNTVQKN